MVHLRQKTERVRDALILAQRKDLPVVGLTLSTTRKYICPKREWDIVRQRDGGIDFHSWFKARHSRFASSNKPFRQDPRRNAPQSSFVSLPHRNSHWRRACGFPPQIKVHSFLRWGTGILDCWQPWSSTAFGWCCVLTGKGECRVSSVHCGVKWKIETRKCSIRGNP